MQTPRSIVAGVALYLDRRVEQLPTIFLQPLEMRLDRDRDVFGIFHRQKIAYELAVMFGLAWEAKSRIPFLLYFRIGHNLNFLGRRWCLYPVRRLLGCFAIHERRLWMELVKECTLDHARIRAILHGISPDPGNPQTSICRFAMMSLLADVRCRRTRPQILERAAFG